ncbi:MAG: hypothetical protein IKB16_11015 [Lentisphaeria bacterium]|nr:hypothetical protein [Lentisphaeria bacterium]
MLDLNNVPGGNIMYDRLTSPVSAIVPDPAARKRKNEIQAASFRLNTDSKAAPILTACEDLNRMAADFTGPEIQLNISTARDNGKSRQYKLSILAGEIRIEAETPAGAARALRRIAARLDLRKAPFLEKGEWTSADSLETALTHPAFKQDKTNTLNWPVAYPEQYLRRIAAAGYTGFHINVDMTLFCQSDLLPEFTNPDAEKNKEDLRKLTELAEKCGLDVYLSLYLHPISGDHPVFARRKDLRGSRFINTDNWYILCSSQPEVHAFYAEQMRNLFSGVPALGGIIAISGCEGWLHCHTANQPGTCPICATKDIEKETATMFNTMAAAVRETAPEAKFIVWNYGIFAWTDICAEKFISLLSSDCTVMANFDTGDEFSIAGVRGTYFDYSLSCTGPSRPYSEQQKTAGNNGNPFMAKLESGAPLEFCSLAYVPAMTRWQRKYDGVMTSATGALFNWKFIGYNEGLAQKAAGYTSMGEGADLIKKMAIREFGKANSAKAVAAWKQFDRAMDFHPFSRNSAGYFKGPFFIGPAQPLFLTEPREVPAIFQNRHVNRATWMTNLQFAEPFGVKAMLYALRKMEFHMAKGCDLMPANAGFHGALCRMFLCFIRTGINMTEFYKLRESFHLESYTPEQALEKIKNMQDIAKQELANTETAMTLLEAYPEMAFSWIYRHGISMEQCQWKIEHTKKLIERELPMKYYDLLFVRNRHPEWLE